MACTGVTMKSGLTNASAEEYITKKHCRECQQHDPSCRPFQIRPDLAYDLFFNGKLDAIVTDQSLPEEYDSFCQEHGIRVMTID